MQMVYSVRWWCHYVRFSLSLYEFSCSSHFALSYGRILKLLYYFFDFYNLPGWLMETSLLFFRKWCSSSSLWFLPCPGIMTCFSSACPVSWSFLIPQAEAHTRRQLQSEGRCSFSISGVVVSQGSGREILGCGGLPTVVKILLQYSGWSWREKGFLQSHPTQLIQPED